MGSILETAGRSLDTVRPARRELTSLQLLQGLAFFATDDKRPQFERILRDVTALLQAAHHIKLGHVHFDGSAHSVAYIDGLADLVAAAARLDGIDA